MCLMHYTTSDLLLPFSLGASRPHHFNRIPSLSFALFLSPCLVDCEQKFLQGVQGKKRMPTLPYWSAGPKTILWIVIPVAVLDKFKFHRQAAEVPLFLNQGVSLTKNAYPQWESHRISHILWETGRGLLGTPPGEIWISQEQWQVSQNGFGSP